MAFSRKALEKEREECKVWRSEHFLAEEGTHDSRVLERAMDFRQSTESRPDVG